MTLLILVWFLNFAISWWNAYAVGLTWAESKIVGGFPRVLAWCGAVMSACGFTWCYLILLAFGAMAGGYLEEPYAKGALELGYLIIILPVLGSGLAIWAESLVAAWKERNWINIGRAGWNTFAQAHNMYRAASAIPEAFSDLGDLFNGGNSDDSKGKMLVLMIALVVFALIGGIITTATILRIGARTTARASKRLAEAL